MNNLGPPPLGDLCVGVFSLEVACYRLSGLSTDIPWEEASASFTRGQLTDVLGQISRQHRIMEVPRPALFVTVVLCHPSLPFLLLGLRVPYQAGVSTCLQ